MTTTVDEALARRAEMLDEAQSLEAQAAACLAEYTRPELEAAVSLLKGIRLLNKEVDATFDDLIDMAFQQHKKTIKRKRKYADPLTAAETIIKDKIKEFYAAEYDEQTEKYLEKTARAREVAQKMRESELAQLRAAGMTEQADNLEAAALAIVPIPRPAPTRIKGISTSELWSAEVLDEDAVFKHCMENEEWRHILTISMKELNTLARMQKDSMNFPGARAVSKQSITVKVQAEVVEEEDG
jgi:hypothetical protein